MATNGEKLTFYTTPATYVGPMRADHTTPYARVIGIRAGNIALMCADVPPAAVRDETVIRVEPLFCTRLLGHFAGYHLGDIGVPFNCHLTAAEVQPGMIGSTAYHDTLARADTVMRDGVECDFSAGLPLGVQGIIGDRLTGEAYHSVTGLGEDNPLFLQTMDCQGPMGLASLDYLQTEINHALRGLGHAGRSCTKFCVAM